MRTIVAMLTLVLGMASQLPANAAALKVAPVSLSVSAPAAATTLRLTNAANRPANVQIRVFRWSQTDGKDQLEPTRDVVVSPPIAALGAGAQQTVRVENEPISVVANAPCETRVRRNEEQRDRISQEKGDGAVLSATWLRQRINDQAIAFLT